MTFRVSLLSLAISLLQAVRPPSPSLLIVNGQLIDGTGAAPRLAAIRISGDVIEAVGSDLTRRPGERVIEAGGRNGHVRETPPRADLL
jgi:hypothetical protein